MPLTPGWVKNISRRVLWAALEKDITKKERIVMQEYFNNECAYCGETLFARWHADHLIPVDQGGFNHISNRVPACPRCNEKEKRESDWQQFLVLKSNSDKKLQSKRRRKILNWVKDHSSKSLPVTEKQRLLWKKEVEKLALAFDAAYKTLKQSKI